MEFRKVEKGEIHEESLKAKFADFVQPWDYEKIKEFIFGDEKLMQWLQEEVQDIKNVKQVNYFIRDHALALAQEINRRKVPTYAIKKANEDSVFTVELGEMFHCLYCGMRIDEDVNGQFIGDPGVIYTAHCKGCHKNMSVEIDTETTEQYRGIEGSLKALTAAPDFQMEMQLGDILPSPYKYQIALDIKDLLKQQSDLPISLPEGFDVVIPEGGYDYHAEDNPIEGFPGGLAPHEWYFGGSFEIFAPDGNTITGYGDFSVDGLWNSEDGEVVGNSLTILNLRPMEENELGIGR